jgi:hypothetical protein
MTIEYPHIEVNLTENDGNAFMIMGLVTRAMRRAGVDAESIDAYRAEAMSGNYDNLLQVTMRTVNVS